MIGTRGIVIEIKDNEARGLMFSSFLGRVKVERRDSAPIENGRIAVAIKKLLSSFPAHIPITLVLPGNLFMVRKINVPFTDRKKIRKILSYEMDGILPVPAGDTFVDSIISSASGRGSDVIAMAIPKRLIYEYMNLFPDGRRPHKVVPDFLSLLSLGIDMGGGKGLCGIIRIEKGAASMVFMSDRRPVLFRAVKTDDIAGLSADVKTTLKSIAGDMQRVDRLYVSGSGATSEAIQELSKMKEAGKVIPAPHVAKNISITNMPSWAVAAGAVISETEYPWFNILGAGAESEHYERFLKTCSIGIVILLAFVTGNLFIRFHVDEKNYNVLKSASKNVFLSIKPEVKNVVKEEVQLKNFLDKEKALKTTLTGESHISYVEVLRGVESILKDRSDIKVRELTFDGNMLVVAGDGYAISADNVEKIFSDIKEIKAVQVEEITQGVGSGNSRFRVRSELIHAPSVEK